jgi:hypothetical protein
MLSVSLQRVADGGIATSDKVWNGLMKVGRKVAD